jgi:hypothetical protein
VDHNVAGTNPANVGYDVRQKVIHSVTRFPALFSLSSTGKEFTMFSDFDLCGAFRLCCMCKLCHVI